MLNLTIATGRRLVNDPIDFESVIRKVNSGSRNGSRTDSKSTVIRLK